MISLEIVLRLQSYAICIGMLLVVLIKTVTEKDNDGIQSKIYTAIICFTLGVLTVEAAGWVFDGNTGAYARAIVTASDALEQVLMLSPVILWVMYADYFVYSSNSRLKRIAILSGIMFIYFAILSFTAPVNHLLFYIDSANRYHRGPWFWQPQLVTYLFLIYVMIILVMNRKKIDLSLLIPMMLFPVLPIIGTLLQMLFYGLSTAWSGVSISILIVYIYIQSQKSSIDYLTGLYNRRHLDIYLNNNIRGRGRNQLLGVLMIDVDRLKGINDTWGHEMGDRALKHCARILRKCFRRRDFIARYAGDEFVAVLELENENDIHVVIKRLEDTLKEMKDGEDIPYKLSFSVGYGIFPDDGIDAARILKMADERMYHDKKDLNDMEAS